jgi:hypothetical protein
VNVSPPDHVRTQRTRASNSLNRFSHDRTSERPPRILTNQPTKVNGVPKTFRSLHDWWNHLDRETQQKYLKMHPRSKMHLRTDHIEHDEFKDGADAEVNHPFLRPKTKQSLFRMTPTQKQQMVEDLKRAHDELGYLHPKDHLESLGKELSPEDTSLLSSIFSGRTTQYGPVVKETLKKVLKTVLYSVISTAVVGNPFPGLLYSMYEDLVNHQWKGRDFFKAWFNRIRHRVVHAKRHIDTHENSGENTLYFSNLDSQRQEEQRAVLEELRDTVRMPSVSDTDLTNEVKRFKYQ